MEFIRVEDSNLIVQNLFNEEHALQLLNSVRPTFTAVIFRNVGVKIMKLILNALEEVRIAHVCIDYNWNQIMMTPKLVCYDKNQWKTLQQLNNWNREWCQLFSNCYFLSSVELSIKCSWMDKQFASAFLEGVSRVPNIKTVKVNLCSKQREVEEVVEGVRKAQIFGQFDGTFLQIC